MSNDLTNLLAIRSSVEKKDWKAVEIFFNESQQASHLGVCLDLSNPDMPVCKIQHIKPFHLGGVGQNFINGGIISAIVDFAIGFTALKQIHMGGFATNKLNIDLVRPIEGQGFYAVSKINQHIGKTIFSEATVFNHKDEPCVFATGSVRLGINPATN